MDDHYFFREYGKDGYLSNFYGTRFIKNGIIFTSSIQAFVFEKCKAFNNKNHELKKQILNESVPYNVIKLEALVENCDETNWKLIKYSVMKNCVREKFLQDDSIKTKLLLTGNEMLYEASPHDRIWGIGFNQNDAPHITKELFGENLLGKILMELREEFYGDKSSAAHTQYS